MSIIKHGRGLQVGKRFLKMSDAAFLDQATAWSKDLTRMKARGPGDTENAMRQIERQYGVDYGFLWSLRYRRERLTECAAQMRKLEHDIAKTEKITGPDNDAVRAAKTLLRQSAGES
jgi:hypothetical protein